MIKKLLVMAALLVPGLAFGADPSADISVQIVPSAPAVPVAAQAAGFTTLAANYDFSQPLYAVQSNWLDCPTTAGNRKIWHQGYGPGVNPALPCDINQVTDPVTGDVVMDARYLSSYDAYGYTGGLNAMGAETYNQLDNVTTADYPSAIYFEAVYRVGGTFSGGGSGAAGGPNGAWWWQALSQQGGATQWNDTIECDITELYAGQGGFANGACTNHFNNAGPNWQSYKQNNLPSGYKITDYHKYGMLYTTDGSTNVYTCLFVDDILQICGSAAPTSVEFAHRSSLIFGVNSFSPPTPQNINMYYKYLRVYSCSSWATTLCFGSTLVNTTMNGKTFTYFH